MGDNWGGSYGDLRSYGDTGGNLLVGTPGDMRGKAGTPRDLRGKPGTPHDIRGYHSKSMGVMW